MYVTPQATVHVAAPKEDDTLERAFTAYLRTGQANADLTELRAQSEGTPSAGGYTVPDGFRTKIIDRMKAFGGIANVAETINTETGQSLEWPTVDDTANVGEIVAEGGTFASGADLTFGTASLGAYTYTAGGLATTLCGCRLNCCRTALSISSRSWRASSANVWHVCSRPTW